MKIEHALSELGLKQNAIATYLACLELGSSTVLRISKRAKVPRSTCDVILAQLQHRGFVSTFRKKKSRYFSAENPRKVLMRLKEKADHFETIMPKLMGLYGSIRTQTMLRTYNGSDGVKLVLQEILEDNPRELLNFSWADDVFVILPDIFPLFVEKRIKQKIPVKVITYDTTFSRKRQQRKNELRDMRFIPKEQEFHAMLSVWNKKIALFSLDKELSACIIEDAELSRMQRTIFFSLWNTLPAVV